MDKNVVEGLFNLDTLNELKKGRIEYVPLSSIVENDLNKIYDRKENENLKESITKDQLLQPLVVYQLNDKNVLLSGHNRIRIIDELLQTGTKIYFFNKEITKDEIPVLVYQKEIPNKDYELLLLLNSNIGRELSEDEKTRIAKEIVRIDANLYPDKKSRPKGIRTRDRYGMISPISGRSVEKYSKDEDKKKKVDKYKQMHSKLDSVMDVLGSLEEAEINRDELATICKQAKRIVDFINYI